MATLWTFGDSLTERYNISHEWSRTYINWKGYIPKVYGEMISEKLGLKLENLGVSGNDNYTIFQIFCDVSHKIKKDDVVIFGWSSPIRFRLVNQSNAWETFLPWFNKNQSGIDGVSVNTIKELMINRDNIKCVEEVNSWISLIDNFLIGVKNVHWTAFDERLKAHMIDNLETINAETNGEVNDNHFSEKGQVELSKILMYNLMGNKTTYLI
jgi:lysophospholipase L1-like esterase